MSFTSLTVEEDKELRELKRRLYPMTRAQRDQPYEMNDAEIVRVLVRVIELLEKWGSP
jgi:hypothetical protein